LFIVPITPLPSIGSVEQADSLRQSTEKNVHIPFADIFQETLTNYEEAKAVSSEDAYRLAMGLEDDLHTVMINSEKATAALELTVQLTSKAVNAYKEIMQMQV
jgi:flagellar hook-basal body complex protein FliE